MAMLNEMHVTTTEGLVQKLMTSATCGQHRWYNLSLFGFILRQADVLLVLPHLWTIAKNSSLRLEWNLSEDAFIFLALQLSHYFQGRKQFSGLPEQQMIFDLIKQHYIAIKKQKTDSMGQKLVLFLSTDIDFP
jgi:hypothetical protein